MHSAFQAGRGWFETVTKMVACPLQPTALPPNERSCSLAHCLGQAKNDGLARYMMVAWLGLLPFGAASILKRCVIPCNFIVLINGYKMNCRVIPKLINLMIRRICHFEEIRIMLR